MLLLILATYKIGSILKLGGVAVGGISAVVAAVIQVWPPKNSRPFKFVSFLGSLAGFGVAVATVFYDASRDAATTRRSADEARTAAESSLHLLAEIQRAQLRFESMSVTAMFTLQFSQTDGMGEYRNNLMDTVNVLTPKQREEADRSRGVSLDVEVVPHNGRIVGARVWWKGALGPRAAEFPLAYGVIRNLTLRVEIYPAGTNLINESGKIDPRAKFGFMALPGEPSDDVASFSVASDSLSIYRAVETRKDLWQVTPTLMSIPDMCGSLLLLTVYPVDADTLNITNSQDLSVLKLLDNASFDNVTITVNNIAIPLSDDSCIYRGHEDTGAYQRVYQMPSKLELLLHGRDR